MVLEHRRSWTGSFDGVDHRIDVVQTLVAVGVLALTIFLVTAATTIVRILN